METKLVKATESTLKEGCAFLEAGDIVAFPTETVYGLGADAYNGEAVARIFEVKKRPQFNPLISHFSSVEDVLKEGVLNEHAIELATHLWPAPISLIVKKRHDSQIHDLVSAGLDTIAVRIPDHPIALKLIKEFGRPIAAPSANISGQLSPTNAAHVSHDFKGIIPMILSGGASAVGLESTVVDCTKEIPVIVRKGYFDEEALSEICGCEIVFQKSSPSKPISPGQLLKHYAPKAHLELNKLFPQEGQAYLGFGPSLSLKTKAPVMNLSEKGDLIEAASNLFAYMHRLDEEGVSSIAVAPIPDEGIGKAINDRLIKAAQA